MTTKEELSVWFDRAVEEGGTHLIVVCDEFDYEDYPVVVGPDANIEEVVEGIKGTPMTRIMEVYNLSKSKEYQLSQIRAFNY